jgi:hypothetical protein
LCVRVHVDVDVCGEVVYVSVGCVKWGLAWHGGDAWEGGDGIGRVNLWPTSVCLSCLPLHPAAPESRRGGGGGVECGDTDAPPCRPCPSCAPPSSPPHLPPVTPLLHQLHTVHTYPHPPHTQTASCSPLGHARAAYWAWAPSHPPAARQGAWCVHPFWCPCRPPPRAGPPLWPPGWQSPLAARACWPMGPCTPGARAAVPWAATARAKTCCRGAWATSQAPSPA